VSEGEEESDMTSQSCCAGKTTKFGHTLPNSCQNHLNMKAGVRQQEEFSRLGPQS